MICKILTALPVSKCNKVKYITSHCCIAEVKSSGCNQQRQYIKHNGQVKQVELISGGTAPCCTLHIAHCSLLLITHCTLHLTAHCTVHFSLQCNVHPSIPALHYIALHFYLSAPHCNGNTLHCTVPLIRGYKTFSVVPTSNGSAVPHSLLTDF